jgi:FkbM family methyltransferase
MQYAWLRASMFVNRFGALPRVTRAFAKLPAGSWTRRRLFGHVIELELSRSSAQQLLLVEGERFVEERHLLRRLLRPGMTAVDVGANIGYYLLLIEQAVGPRGRVICIEPSIENLPELRRTIAANALDNVELHEVALGDHEGSVGLHTGINSGVSEGEAGGAYSVPLRRLDQLVREPVHFLKIDVEGYEGQVLAGASALLEQQRPVLFLELHPHIVGRFGYSVRGILDSLARHYSRIRLYERQASAAQSLFAKVATRYLGRDPLQEVADPSAYVSRYDRADVPHTFWAVCEA